MFAGIACTTSPDTSHSQGHNYNLISSISFGRVSRLSLENLSSQRFGFISGLARDGFDTDSHDIIMNAVAPTIALCDAIAILTRCIFRAWKRRNTKNRRGATTKNKSAFEGYLHQAGRMYTKLFSKEN